MINIWRNQRGFTLIELLLVTAIVSIIAIAAMMTSAQAMTMTGRGNDRMAAIRQSENAGHWISQDAMMAENIFINDDPESSVLLVLAWTEWGNGEDPVYHSVTYTLGDVSEGIGKLRRSHWNSAGVNEDTLIAEGIYYNRDDQDHTTSATYQGRALSIRISASFGEALETREYHALCRPDF